MPELPDITIYLEALERRILGQPLIQLRIASPFVLRTAVPTVESVRGRTVIESRRLGKRIALGLQDDLWLVLHLMIAGRLQWRAAFARLCGKHNLAAFDFPNGTLVVTEAAVALTHKLAREEIERLHRATQETLSHWIELLRKQTGDAFPEHVTAFRPEMAVHGKHGQPCPICGMKVQRIRYADNETNYCPGCQTGGKLLADRSLSMLLKKDWPKTPGELEAMRSGVRR